MLKFNPFRSITLRGAAVAVGGYLWAHFDPNALGGHGPAIVEAVGALVTIFGLRRAQSVPAPASPSGPASSSGTFR